MTREDRVSLILWAMSVVCSIGLMISLKGVGLFMVVVLGVFSVLPFYV